MITTFITRLFRLIRGNRIKRFEFLLPTRYNDGTEVEPDTFNQCIRELTARFGGVTQDLVRAHGAWEHSGTIVHDELSRFRLDSGDPHATAFLRQYKRRLRETFKQLDIWITAHEIEII